jgi:hypothetical protein
MAIRWPRLVAGAAMVSGTRVPVACRPAWRQHVFQLGIQHIQLLAFQPLQHIDHLLPASV